MAGARPQSSFLTPRPVRRFRPPPRYTPSQAVTPTRVEGSPRPAGNAQPTHATLDALRAGPTLSAVSTQLYSTIPSTIYHLPLGALMDISLASLINVYSLSTGRRLFALGQVMKAAKEQTFKDLVAHCDQALEHDHKTRALEAAWAAPNLPAAGPGAVQKVDLALDRT
ncbi:MAG: hypothetical protein IPK82_29315 [Polyangiaceae bacterium]|nr:hypothetical protein [Polyangiaceae bacterium]